MIPNRSQTSRTMPTIVLWTFINHQGNEAGILCTGPRPSNTAIVKHKNRPYSLLWVSSAEQVSVILSIICFSYLKSLEPAQSTSSTVMSNKQRGSAFLFYFSTPHMDTPGDGSHWISSTHTQAHTHNQNWGVFQNPPASWGETYNTWVLYTLEDNVWRRGCVHNNNWSFLAGCLVNTPYHTYMHTATLAACHI